MNVNFNLTKRAVFNFIFLFFILNSTAQNKNVITGVINNASTGKPIPHVEVFVSGTTSGCISDVDGKFKLNVPFLPCTLVADHVSYESFITIIRNKIPQLNINLSPSVFSINEVEVKSKSRRKKNLRYFYSHFITGNRKKIEIQNDSVLYFERNNMKFNARTTEPLIVINHYLGYKIRVVLEEFSVIMKDSPTGKQIPLISMQGGEIMQLTGYYYYEPLKDDSPEKLADYEENRRLTYFGSYRHFLKSVYDGDPEKQGFEIKIFPEEESAAFVEVGNNLQENEMRKYTINADSLVVNYYYDEEKNPIPVENTPGRNYMYKRESVIYPSKEPFYIRKNGTSPKLTFVLDGFMVLQSFANSLPEDYVPPKF